MRTILAGLLLCTAFAVGDAHAQLKTELNAEPSAEDIARGKALTEAGDCASCHTADPAKPFAGGKRIDTPFGGIYSPNLTPDRDTGIGAWSDDDFLPRAALRRRARRFALLSGLPLPEFHETDPPGHSGDPGLSGDADAGPEYAPPPELRWPLNYRVVMRGWNWLFFKPGILMPDQQKSAEWNRGRYLVEGAGHCGACHTPKNMFGADRRGQAFGGGPRRRACSRRGSTPPRAAA